MSVPLDATLTLPVSSLHAATSFYLTALRPLDYQHISTGSHQTSWGSSQVVGLGPAGTSRIDIFLSQAEQSTRRSSPSSNVQVIFPAGSRLAVRDVYTAAINAGGSSILTPQYDQNEDDTAIFAAVVADLDKNKIRIQYEHDSPLREISGNGAQSGGIAQWDPNTGRTCASNMDKGGRSKSRSSAEQLSDRPIDADVKDKGSHAGAASVSKSSQQHVGKHVVGALIGAAAGAVLAYSMVTSQRDSRQRERDFSSRMAARDQVKPESWMPTSPQRDFQNRYILPRRQSSDLQRDSGCWTGNDHPQSLTYSANDRIYREAGSGIRRSVSLNARGGRPTEKDLLKESQSLHRRSRRNSMSTHDLGRDSKSSNHFRRSSTALVTPAPPSSTSRWKELFRPPGPPEAPSAHWHTLQSRTVVIGRSSSFRKDLDSSERPAKSLPGGYAHTARKLAENGSGYKSSITSRKSNRTAFQTALPPSTIASSKTTSKTRERPTRNAPISSSGTKLTASSLAAYNIPLPESSVGGGGAIDDLETIMPDDSISSIGTTTKGRSSTSRYSKK